MKKMLGVLAFCSLAVAARAAEDSAWIRLFNGMDLKDWDIKIRTRQLNVDPLHTFKVVDGNLFVDYSEYADFVVDKTELFGHAAYKARTFSYYLLRSEYQFLTGKQVKNGPGWAKENNGYMLHSQSMASMGLNQDFPVSLEAQLLGPQNGGSTMNLCTPGTAYHDMQGALVTQHCTNAKNETKPPEPAWTSISALVLGDSLIIHMVGKDTVFKFTKPVLDNLTPLKEGYITIQGESAPIRFKSIEVLDLVGCMDKSKAGYRSYFVKNDNSKCNVTSLRPGAAAADFRLALEGASLGISGADGYIEAVRRMDGSLAKGFLPDSRSRSFRVREPGLYLVSVKTPAGTSQRKVAVF